MSRRKKPFPFFLWHRRLGLAALLLVIILSITGIMLNHTEGLQLDQHMVESELVLDWYEINPQGQAINFRLNDHWISQWNEQLFFNGQSLYTYEHRLQGVAQVNQFIALALQSAVLLLDAEGAIIELMPFNTNASIKAIGVMGNRFVLLDQAQHYYLSDAQFTQWVKSTIKPQAEIQWSTASPLGDQQLKQLKQAYRGEGLTLERVILDLHSGRIFNDQWGVYIMDIAALAMLLLSFSGIWIWWSRRLKMRQKKHYQKHH